ncbi:hypothetical protein ACFOYU_15930, partial [Microvirga sp. GCM10011540]|uniref:hypothetical protein n=1 Tax=Microvirga sp. GCM10011540 TaxID=3317338 RepID=UPI003609C28D
STCRNLATISSAVCLFLLILFRPPFGSKAIHQGGPLLWRQATGCCDGIQNRGGPALRMLIGGILPDWLYGDAASIPRPRFPEHALNKCVERFRHPDDLKAELDERFVLKLIRIGQGVDMADPDEVSAPLLIINPYERLRPCSKALTHASTLQYFEQNMNI